jgi:hypothetical protein
MPTDAAPPPSSPLLKAVDALLAFYDGGGIRATRRLRELVAELRRARATG